MPVGVADNPEGRRVHGRRQSILQAYTKKIFFELLFYSGYRAIQDLLPFVHQDDMVADLFHLFHPMGAEDDGGAFAGEGVDLVFYQVRVDGVETAERFVEDDEPRFM